MGIGERQPETKKQIEEQGPLNPPTNKDPEFGIRVQQQQKQGILQKIWSTKIPLVYVLVGPAIALTVIIALSFLHGRETPLIPCTPLRSLCPANWDLYNGKCYYFSANYDTWKNSQKFCESHNSSLAVIDNSKELDFLKKFKDERNYWIGLSRTEDDSGWLWINGTQYIENIFHIERFPIPNKGDSERAFLNHDGVKSGSENIEKKWFCTSVPKF